MDWEDVYVMRQIIVRWKNSQEKNKNKKNKTISQEGNIGNIIYKANLLNRSII